MRTTETVWRRPLPTRRAFDRRNTWVHALLRFEGRSQSIVVRNISRGGMKIEYAYGLMPGDKIEIELMAGRKLQGTVAWSVAAYCGVEFPAPLAEDDPVLETYRTH
jgi:PilZ domain